jgi:subtilase family serine protease
VDVTFDLGGRTWAKVVIDRDNKVVEIFEENNSAVPSK